MTSRAKNRIIAIVFDTLLAALVLLFAIDARAEVVPKQHHNTANVNVHLQESNINVQRQQQNFNREPQIATLPSELSKNQIKTMAIGEQGFNTPSVMIVDEDGRCYLIGNTSNESNKKYEMKYGWIQIVRQKDGYYVNVVKGENTLWTRQPIAFLRDRLESRDLIPVKKIHIMVR